MVWDINGEWIDDVIITPGRSGDSPVSLRFELHPGKTYVFDRAYNDFSSWVNIIDAASHFVCRLKENPKNKDLLIEVLSNNKDRDGVLYDEPYKPSDVILKDISLKTTKKLNFVKLFIVTQSQKKYFILLAQI